MKVRGNLFLKSLSLLMVFLLTVPFSALAEAAKTAPQTSINFKEPSYVVPDKRITLNAEIKDPAGVKLVRCYFRAAGEADYVFVPMTKEAGSSYVATLPAPAKTATALELLLLAVNADNFVVKTKAATVSVDSSREVPPSQQSASAGAIQVSTELPQAPQAVAGFADNIAVDVAESAARFGVVAGLGSAAAVAATGGGSTAAVAGVSTVSAVSAGGLSTGAIVAIAAGAVAAVGAGVAVGVSSGGGGGGGGGGSGGGSGSGSAVAYACNKTSTVGYTTNYKCYITVTVDSSCSGGYFTATTSSSSKQFPFTSSQDSQISAQQSLASFCGV